MTTWRTLLLAAALLLAFLRPPGGRSVVATSTASTSSNPISILLRPKSALSSPISRPTIAAACCCNSSSRIELMADAAVKAKLDSGQSFEDRLKYHRRRTLRDAYYDKAVRNAVTDAEAKKIYDAKVAGMKPEEEIHARHILVATEGGGRGNSGAAEEGRGFRHGRQGESRRTRAPRAAISAFSARSDAEAVRGRRLRAQGR